jgi:hypothetical protein
VGQEGPQEPQKALAGVSRRRRRLRAPEGRTRHAPYEKGFSFLFFSDFSFGLWGFLIFIGFIWSYWSYWSDSTITTLSLASIIFASG